MTLLVVLEASYSILCSTLCSVCCKRIVINIVWKLRHVIMMCSIPMILYD